MDSPAVADEVLNLNVGGCIYTTSRSTLTRFPDSMLGSMFSDRLPSNVDDCNRYVIDGDGPTFRHILNFLRRSKLILPDNFQEWDILSAEADFYQIQELIQLIDETREQNRQSQIEEQEAIKSYEFLEVEFECANGQWLIFGKPKLVGQLSAIKCCFAQLANYKSQLKKAEVYGLTTPRGKSVKRLQLFKEITELGFMLVCTSSSGGDERSTDRWTFSRHVAEDFLNI
ncbi:BTB/POZ domain-containing protein KCTD6-like [Anneissia japonica]|uniref:BTB/POZ domain-containing protein KCTD6-like n=1 Tax=Anneissia japonica TaxID=1529436 RepID=UPI0014257293|nr:BTB/POZ domain-containing protein KCTD6-like [Anneissia japonica]